MMYPSLNKNGSSLISTYCNDNIYSNIPQEVYHNPASSSSFLHSSPIYIPLEDEAFFCEIFQQQQFFSNDHNHNILGHELSDYVNSVMGECSNYHGQISKNDGDNDRCDFITYHVKPDNDSSRKISSNKDRHSKINTARGPRDRRMRLSLDVAKRFFELQDILGFDKASKTVDWLLTESKSAIQDLLIDPSTSSISEGETMSGTGDQFIVKTGSGSSKKQKEKVSRVRKYGDFYHPLAKETRVRARQRARERTKEKQKNYKHGIDQDSAFRPFLDQVMEQDENQLGSWCPRVDQQNQMSSNFEFTQGFVGGSSSLFPSYNFDDQHSSGLMDEDQLNDLYI